MQLCLVGGFLGSGKTTAITTASKILLKKKIPVAVIINDQGSQLVDTAFANSLHIPTHEVRNGCFCCNYEQFSSAIQHLNDSVHPDIIFAEAVGSCADLVATIVKPMRRFEPEIKMQLSVFADGPVLLSSLEDRSSFITEDVQYLYKKQLEEAGILIVNKSDTLTEAEMNKIKIILESEYPEKKLLFQDSRDETAIKKWLNVINENSSNTTIRSLDIDYKKYADGEAALAWLDACVNIHSKGKAITKSFEVINDIFDAITFKRIPIGHLKFFLQSGDWQQKISYTANDRVDKKDRNNNVAANHAMVLINARVETDPDQLKKIFFQAIRKIESQNCHIEILHLDSFQPGYPKPTYRLSG